MIQGSKAQIDFVSEAEKSVYHQQCRWPITQSNERVLAMEQNRLLSKPIAYTVFVLIGALFVFCIVTGEELAETGNILWTAEHTLFITGISLAGGGIVGVLCCMFFYVWAGMKKTAVDDQAGGSLFHKAGKWLWRAPKPGKGRRFFFGSLFLDFLAWFPAFLAYYPAICAYDVPIQTGQIVSGAYNDHHPIAHTLLLKWAMDFGKNVLGSVNGGIAAYALFQMLLLGTAFAFGVYFLYRHGVKRVWLLIVQMFCMFYPFHAYMSVSVTKDTVFSAFFLIALLALQEMNMGHKAYMPVFFFAGIGVILFRNNGKYAFLALLVFLLAAVCFDKNNRALRGRVFLTAAAVFVVGNMALSGIFKATGAEQGDKREMLCLPIQQLSRTMIYHGGIGVIAEDDGAMPDTDKALINDFILDEGYRAYRADFTDPVKSHTNTYVARYRAKDFLTTYVGLFFRFPGDYVNAALTVNAGYLYPNDVTHAYINAQEGQAAGGGYVQTRWSAGELNERGIYKASKWPWLYERMEKWADDNAYLKIPVIKYLFVPGVWIWWYLLFAGWLLIKRNFTGCIPLMLVFGYFLTLLLGPTVQLRYLYPVMAAFPFLLLSGTAPETD